MKALIFIFLLVALSSGEASNVLVPAGNVGELLGISVLHLTEQGNVGLSGHPTIYFCVS